MVLDLSGVEFLCVRSGLMLIDFGAECSQAGVEFSVVTSPAVDRALRVIDGSDSVHKAELLTAYPGANERPVRETTRRSPMENLGCRCRIVNG